MGVRVLGSEGKNVGLEWPKKQIVINRLSLSPITARQKEGG